VRKNRKDLLPVGIEQIFNKNIKGAWDCDKMNTKSGHLNI
jgi:hypothetical protein